MPRRKQDESERLCSVRLSVSLPQQLHDQLERKAHENDASIAWVVRRPSHLTFEEVTAIHQLTLGINGVFTA